MSGSWADEKSKKITNFEVSSSLILHIEPFLYQWILYDKWWWPAQSLNQKEALTHFRKANLHYKKVTVTGGLLPVWSTTAFWVLVKPLPLRSMLSKLTRCIENCNACSWHWSTEWAKFSTQHLTIGHTTNASKVEQIWLWSFVPSAIFTWPLTSWLPQF